jgi:hypothetical protein
MRPEDGQNLENEGSDKPESKPTNDIFERFSASLDKLKTSDDMSLSSTATRVSRKIKYGHIYLRTTTEEETDINPITAFELDAVSYTPPLVQALGSTDSRKIIPKLGLKTSVLGSGIREVKVEPGIVLNSSEFAIYDDDIIMQDLLRTIAVADQYPHKGYTRRYKDIYTRALKEQARWQESLGMKTLDYDSETADMHSMLELLLTDEAQEADCGIDDWLAVIERAFPGLTPKQKDIIDYFRDPKVFLGLRELYLMEISVARESQVSQRYLDQLNGTQKAEIAAQNILRRAFYNSIYTLN